MRGLRVSLVVMLLGAGCANQSSTIEPDHRDGAGERVYGQQDAIEFTSSALQREGYQRLEVQSAEEVRPNFWKIRFGLAPRESGRVLDVYFDGAQQKVVKKIEAVEDGPASKPNDAP
jgi:hypothetical protein